MTNNRTSLNEVIRITEWGLEAVADFPNGGYWADVVYRDGTNGVLRGLTNDEWQQLTKTEVDSEIAELNAPPFTQVENRNEHNECDYSICCPTCNGGTGGCYGEKAHGPEPTDQEITDALVDQGECTHAEIEAISKYNDAVAFIASHCNAHPDDFGLCSWCRSYYNRVTNERLQLSDAQYKLTVRSESGASHGICLTCKEKLSAEIKVRREMK